MGLVGAKDGFFRVMKEAPDLGKYLRSEVLLDAGIVPCVEQQLWITCTGASSALHLHGVIQAGDGAVSPTCKGSGQGLQLDTAPTSYMVTGKHCWKS